jgi:hypothetical protein
MRKIFLLPLALALAACTTPANQANVVRFHGDQPISRGTVAIIPANTAQANSLEFRVQADAVAAELQRQGFQPVPAASSAQFVATVDLTTSERATAPRRSGVSIGVGGGFSTGNVGIGTSMQVPVGGQPRPGVATTTTLSVQMKTSAGVPVWEGRASVDSAANSATSGTAAAPALAGALFRDFPGQSGRQMKVAL